MIIPIFFNFLLSTVLIATTISSTERTPTRGFIVRPIRKMQKLINRIIQ